jgi:phosphatidate cytidylyltransferase
MNGLRRVLTAAALLPVLWATIVLAPPWVFVVLTLLTIATASWECYRMLESRGPRPFRALGIVASLALIGPYLAEGWRYDASLPLIAATLLTVALAIVRRSTPDTTLETCLNTLFPILFIGLTLSYIVGLRMLPGEDGKDVVLLLLVCVMLGDTAAFYVGSAIGRRKLAPRLSPKKSWEGAIAGVVGSVAGALIAYFGFYQRLSLTDALVLGVLLGIAGIVGDLAESVIKRSSGFKDSSSLLPGHGGVMDRTDSLLFSAPILYYYYFALLQG